MVKLSSQLCVDFQLGGFLSSHTTAIRRPPGHSNMSDRAEKQAPGKQTREPLALIHTWIVNSLM